MPLPPAIPPPAAPRTLRTLCFGEVLVDLICEDAVDTFADATSFVPHFGGATANVALTAAREGVPVGFAGGVGRDSWGTWLCARLAAEGVDVSWLREFAPAPTPLACVTLNGVGEPAFVIYGSSIGDGIAAIEPEIEDAVRAFDGLFFGSNTLVEMKERRVTVHARDTALRAGRPIVFDANIRLDRWSSEFEATTTIRDLIPGVRLLRANQAEACLLAGADDPADAARGLQAIGADSVVVTLGERGALLLTSRLSHAPGVRARRVRSTVGAGDAFTGVLLAALARNEYDPEALHEVLGRAVAAGARATERWGATAATRDQSQADGDRAAMTR